MRRFIAYGPALLVLLTTGLALLAAPSAIRQVQLASVAATLEVAQRQLDESTLLERINLETNAVAEGTLPSVAHILSLRNDGRRFGSRSTGSGWVYDDRGHVVTNAHVVEGGDSARVELHDGRVLRASIVGVDRRTDIAVLRVEGDPEMFPIRRATSEALSMGDRVFAFGSPFGIKFSMSQGIVSGLGRSEGSSWVGGGGYTNYIQTDAAINPGNSGGPLVDVNGRLVGMNAAIANNREQQAEDGELQGQSAGIGFAIPLETIESVVRQLIEDDVIVRGYLGVSIDGYPRAGRTPDDGFIGSGVQITRLAPGEPAQRSGLRVGDVIVSIAGVPTPNTEALRSTVSVREPGKPVDFQVWRGNSMLNIEVAIGAATDDARLGLRYIPGSESMTEKEIRAIARERQASAVNASE